MLTEEFSETACVHSRNAFLENWLLFGKFNRKMFKSKKKFCINFKHVKKIKKEIFKYLNPMNLEMCASCE